MTTGVSSNVQNVLLLSFLMVYSLVLGVPTTNTYSPTKSDTGENTSIMNTRFYWMPVRFADSMAVENANPMYIFQTFPETSNPSPAKTNNNPVTTEKKSNEINLDAKTVENVLKIMLSEMEDENYDINYPSCNYLVEKRSTDTDFVSEPSGAAADGPNVSGENNTTEANDAHRNWLPEPTAEVSNSRRPSTQPIIHSHIPVGIGHIYSPWPQPFSVPDHIAGEPSVPNQFAVNAGQTFSPYVQPFHGQIYGSYQSFSALPPVSSYDFTDSNGFVKRVSVFKAPVLPNSVQQYWHPYPIPPVLGPMQNYPPKQPTTEIRIPPETAGTKLNSTKRYVPEIETLGGGDSNEHYADSTTEPTETILSQNRFVGKHYTLPALPRFTLTKKLKLPHKILPKLKQPKLKDRSKLARLAELNKEYQNKCKLLLSDEK